MTSQLLIQSENRKFAGQISVRWQINTNYVDPLLFDLSTLVWPETSDLNELVEFICDLLLKNSLPLAAPVLLAVKSVNLAFMLVYVMMSRRLVHHAKMPL